MSFFQSLLFLSRHSKASFLGVLSSVFEWYDYALFGYFAALLSKNFFPADNEMTALLSGFAVFASGFAMRPLGALLFGYIGDRKGHKVALMGSMFLMAVPTTLLGLLPPFEVLGYGATAMLVVIRLLQGLAVGGNYGGSFIVVIENTPPSHQSLAGSLAMCGALGGLFVGSGAAYLVTALCDETTLVHYGWRIPFLFGGLSAWVGHLMRKHLPEKAATVSQERSLKPWLKELFQAMGVILLDGMGVYLLFVFMTTYANLFLGISCDVSLLSNTIAMALLTLVIPFFGYLSDLYGAHRILRYVSIAFILLPLPFYGWLSLSPSGSVLMVLQSVFALVIGGAYGALPKVVVSTFPPHIRYTACGLAFNISVGIFGGASPFMATGLINLTGWVLIPAFLLTIVGVVSFIAIRGMSVNEKYAMTPLKQGVSE